MQDITIPRASRNTFTIVCYASAIGETGNAFGVVELLRAVEQSDSVQHRLHQHFESPRHVLEENQVRQRLVVHAAQMAERRVPQEVKLLLLRWIRSLRSYSVVLQNELHRLQLQQQQTAFVAVADVQQELQRLGYHHFVVGPVAQIAADLLPDEGHHLRDIAEAHLRDERAVRLEWTPEIGPTSARWGMGPPLESSYSRMIAKDFWSLTNVRRKIRKKERKATSSCGWQR